MNIPEGLIIFLVSEIIVFLGLIWKVSANYGELKQADKQNHEDINNIARKQRRVDKLLWQRMDSLEEYMRENLDYQPPSLNLFDEDK